MDGDAFNPEVWWPIQDCPEEFENPIMWFKFKDGRVLIGKWQPYWCGSDCPCNVSNEPEFDEFFSEFPDCWCCYPMDSGAVAEYGLEEDPTHWAPCAEAD